MYNIDCAFKKMDHGWMSAVANGMFDLSKASNLHTSLLFALIP